MAFHAATGFQQNAAMHGRKRRLGQIVGIVWIDLPGQPPDPTIRWKSVSISSGDGVAPCWIHHESSDSNAPAKACAIAVRCAGEAGRDEGNAARRCSMARAKYSCPISWKSRILPEAIN